MKHFRDDSRPREMVNYFVSISYLLILNSSIQRLVKIPSWASDPKKIVILSVNFIVIRVTWGQSRGGNSQTY